MPPPMIRVMRGKAASGREAVGLLDKRGASGGAGEALDGPFCEASRRITLTSSSTERPLRAAPSRSASRIASSSFRIVRLAILTGSVQIDSNAIINLIALQSKLADGEQDPNEGQRDNPEGNRPPTALAAFGPPHRRDGVGRERQAFPCHGFELPD